MAHQKNDRRHIAEYLHGLVIVLLLICAVGCAGESKGLHFRSRPSFDRRTGDLILSVKVHGNGRIYRLSPGKAPTVLSSEGDSFDPNVSKDGKNIVYAREAPSGMSEIWIMGIDGQGARRLTSGHRDGMPVTCGATSAVFLRSSRLRQTSTGGERWLDAELHIAQLGAETSRRLGDATFYQVSRMECLSDDSGVLLAHYPRDSVNRLEIVDLVSGNMRRIGLEGDSNGSSGLQTGRITFTRDVGNFNYEIFVMRPDGGSRHQITHLNSYTISPVFSPDERRVLFLSDESRRQRFRLLQVDLETRTVGPTEFEFPDR